MVGVSVVAAWMAAMVEAAEVEAMAAMEEAAEVKAAAVVPWVWASSKLGDDLVVPPAIGLVVRLCVGVEVSLRVGVEFGLCVGVEVGLCDLGFGFEVE